MASERKYNIGDVVVVRYDMKPYHEFGEYNYPIGTPYIPGERLTIDRFQRGNEYGVAEKPIILRDNLIDHIETRENRSEPNIMEKGRYYKVTDTGVEKTPDGKTFTMIGKCLEEGGEEEDGMYRCEAAFITPTHKEINKRKSWCYKDRRIRTFEPASPREIKWVNHCLRNNKFISLLEFKELELKEVYNGNSAKSKKVKDFPDSGWCSVYNEEIIRYVAEKSENGLLRACKQKGKSGFAWQRYNGRKWNSWPVIGHSGKVRYSAETLLNMMYPDRKDTLVMDIETEGFKVWTPEKISQMEGREIRNASKEGKIILHNPYTLDTPVPNIDPLKLAETMHTHQRKYDSLVSTAMAMTSSFTAKDKFTQQEPVILKRKKKKKKLISC